MNNRIDITDDFERANRKAERKEKWKRRLDWCLDHWEICASAFVAGIGLVTTGIKVGGKCYNNHIEYRNKNLSFELFDEIFGAPNENDEDVTFCITLSASLNSAIRAKAAKTNQSVSACINEILRESLK